MDRLFIGPGQVLAYTSHLNGKRFATQWSLYKGPAGEPGSGLHEFAFLLEIDPLAIGQGGSLVTQRSQLVCDDALRPLRYRSQTRGSAVSLEFKADSVEAILPDGSHHTVPLEGADVVLESNLIGLQALMLAQAHGAGRLGAEARFQVFLVNGMLPAPYRTTPAPDLEAAEGGTWLRSSHEEELRLDHDGCLVLSRLPTQAVEIRREQPAPPLPAWHDAEVLTLDRPTYAPPPGHTFELHDVELPGPITPLGGTVTLPRGTAPFPAVLFLGGSGSHDRNGISGEIDLGSHEIVDHLAERGLLGLRYDTRGAGKTLIGKDVLEQGLETVIADARAALAYLRSRPEVDRGRIFLIGHSQGGTVALALASAPDAGLAGVVLMAAVGRAIDEALIDQVVNHGRKLGLAQATVEAQVQQVRDYVDAACSGRPWVPGEIPDHLFAGARTRRWILEHMRHRSDQLVAKVSCPILVLQGGKDFQVSPEKDAERIVAAAEAAGRDVTYTLFPDLDHTFKRTEGNSTMVQYYDRSRHVDGGFLDVLGTWLSKRAHAAAPEVA
ncbi:MAG: alpha/beta fold hydrolase [Deltaproteobacteria bacterium]|nr:alpha/beta fold hydrolase [Deltaproteobacteria bacterium]